MSPAWTSGKQGGALVLDGTATCMTIAGSQQVAASGPFTVTVFASVTAFAVGSIAGYILAKTKKVPDAPSWRFGSDTTSSYSLRIGAASGATQIATPDGQASNTWVHVAAVFDPGKRMELWVDGARLSNATTPPVDLVDDPTAPLRVGCLVTSNYFKGKLDERRLSDVPSWRRRSSSSLDDDGRDASRSRRRCPSRATLRPCLSSGALSPMRSSSRAPCGAWGPIRPPTFRRRRSARP